MNKQEPNFSEITRKASKTFYFASLLYPADIRRDIHILYSFLRVSDNMVDAVVPDASDYAKFKEQTKDALNGQTTEHSIVNAFAGLVARRRLDSSLVWEYFRSQDIDLSVRSYSTYEELLGFVYGVAEVVGLFMAQIMELPEESYGQARQLGRAMQLVNILRDIEEDSRLGKQYVPTNELVQYGLPTVITKEVVVSHPLQFVKFMHFQLDRAENLIVESEKGLKFFPQRYVLPVRVSMNLYKGVIQHIRSNPLIVFDHKVRPTNTEIVLEIVKGLFGINKAL